MISSYPRYLLLIAVGSLFFGTGCLKDQCAGTQQFIRYDPVYLTADSMRVEVKVDGPEELRHPGNIYYYENYLLINERSEGVHVIDNHDPSNPVNLAFIRIPGNRDMAVRNHTLYVDMFIDLVALDITDIMHPVEVCRVENVFSSYFSFDATNGYIVDWVPTTVTEEIDCSNAHWNDVWWRRGGILLMSVDFAYDPSINTAELAGGASSSASGETGIAGSMARFTLVHDYLYTLDQSQMHVFDVTASCPEQKNTVSMQWGIETLFPYKDYLFVGSNNGMLIYDNQNPETPTYLTTFAHAQACDPVFVLDDIAYVTLRDGTTCQNFTNELDVIDVSNITNPSLIKSYPMDHPHGLSVMDDILYLCDGEHGLKIFDVTDKTTINKHLLAKVGDINTFDVIVLPGGELAMVIGADGLYQFDTSDKTAPVELSKISVTP